MVATDATNSDLDDLVKFLNQTRTVLRNTHDAREVLFRQSTRPLIEKALPPVEQEIENCLTQLQSRNTILKENLGKAGLSGPQLALKLAGFNRVYNRFVERGTVKLLLKTLSWINKILGSLISAIPGAEPIKEFKEAVEEELDDSDV